MLAHRLFLWQLVAPGHETGVAPLRREAKKEFSLQLSVLRPHRADGHAAAIGQPNHIDEVRRIAGS